MPTYKEEQPVELMSPPPHPFPTLSKLFGGFCDPTPQRIYHGEEETLEGDSERDEPTDSSTVVQDDDVVKELVFHDDAPNVTTTVKARVIALETTVKAKEVVHVPEEITTPPLEEEPVMVKAPTVEEAPEEKKAEPEVKVVVIVEKSEIILKQSVETKLPAAVNPPAVAAVKPPAVAAVNPPAVAAVAAVKPAATTEKPESILKPADAKKRNVVVVESGKKERVSRILETAILTVLFVVGTMMILKGLGQHGDNSVLTFGAANSSPIKFDIRPTISIQEDASSIAEENFGSIEAAAIEETFEGEEEVMGDEETDEVVDEETDEVVDETVDKAVDETMQDGEVKEGELTEDGEGEASEERIIRTE